MDHFLKDFKQDPTNKMKDKNTVSEVKSELKMKQEKILNIYPIYLTPPLGQDMTQGQFLSGV